MLWQKRVNVCVHVIRWQKRVNVCVHVIRWQKRVNVCVHVIRWQKRVNVCVHVIRWQKRVNVCVHVIRWQKRVNVCVHVIRWQKRVNVCVHVIRWQKRVNVCVHVIRWQKRVQEQDDPQRLCVSMTVGPAERALHRSLPPVSLTAPCRMPLSKADPSPLMKSMLEQKRRRGSGRSLQRTVRGVEELNKRLSRLVMSLMMLTWWKTCRSGKTERGEGKLLTVSVTWVRDGQKWQYKTFKRDR